MRFSMWLEADQTLHSFMQSIITSFTDALPLLVACDWLDENGMEHVAEPIRTLVTLATTKKTQGTAAEDDRLAESERFRAGVEPDGLGCLTRGVDAVGLWRAEFWGDNGYFNPHHSNPWREGGKDLSSLQVRGGLDEFYKRYGSQLDQFATAEYGDDTFRQLNQLLGKMRRALSDATEPIYYPVLRRRVESIRRRVSSWSTFDPRGIREVEYLASELDELIAKLSGKE